ncbi:MAG: hypothetical protein EOO77_08025, partial [Oxalobacteraceae bacterium]
VLYICYERDTLTIPDDSIKPVILVGPLEGSFAASFLLGWGVTTGAGLASYPLDTIRRRMMMTSGGTVHYKSMFDAGSQIVAKEGVKSLFKGAGANILRGVAGAGVLSLYDKMQELMFGKVYSVSAQHVHIYIGLLLTFRVDLVKRDVFFTVSKNLPPIPHPIHCLDTLASSPFFSFWFPCDADIPDRLFLCCMSCICVWSSLRMPANAKLRYRGAYQGGGRPHHDQHFGSVTLSCHYTSYRSHP